MSNNLGIILDPNSFKNMRSVAEKAERNGFHSIWVTELFRSSFEQLTFLSSFTNEIKIGSAITLAFTRSPLVTVISALDIDELSEGRLILGIGSGAMNTNRKWHNFLDFDHPSKRIESFYKVFRGIEKSIVKKNDLKFKDNYYNLELRGFKRPFDTFRSQIPLFLGGIGTKMTHISKNLFQGYIGHVVCSKSYIKDKILPVFDKNNANHTLSSIILCAINKNRKKALLDAKGTIAFYSIVKAYSSPFIDLGFEDNIKKIRKAFFQNDVGKMIDNVTDEMVTNFAICGTPEEAKEQLNYYIDILDLPILSPPHYYLEKSIVESYQNEILENFKI